jgi:hypothetical protein
MILGLTILEAHEIMLLEVHMRKLIIFSLLSLIGCGQGPVGPQGTPGIAGPTGNTGVSGLNSLMTFTRQSSVSGCENGGLIVANGLDINRNNLLDAEEITAISYVCDGKTGAAGENGISPQSSEFDIINVITPCGIKAGIFNESLLELRNGDIIAYFEQGNTRFLNVLQPGYYQTSDSKACRFTIDNNGGYHE